MSLTPEREALLRELRYEDGSAVTVSYQDARNLIGEIDALRARVAALEEAGEGLADAIDVLAQLKGGRADVALDRWHEVKEGKGVDREAARVLGEEER